MRELIIGYRGNKRKRTEERKNKQIDDMKRKHDRAFTEIKNYYNDITLNNLAMISTLKEEIKSKEEKLERNEQVG